MKRFIILLIFAIFAVNGKISAQNMKTYTATIVQKPFKNKIGKNSIGANDLYAKFDGGGMVFIKFLESKVERDEIRKYLGKKIKITGQLRDGLWDTNDPNVQSRVGQYLYIEKFEEI